MDIKGLKFGYDRKNILLSDLSARLRKGKITSVIGPNGCGKSTLLHLLTKLNKPMGGSILVDGREIGQLKGKEFARKAASVCQINDGEEDITAEELVRYGRTPYKRSFEPLNAADERVVDDALRETGLAAMRFKKLSNMSGGERQRVYIAMALCQQPEILFLDEPTSYLDIYYQIEVLDIVKRINREKGITVIMVLHDINQALHTSDDVLVMKAGAVVAFGRAEAVIDRTLIRKVYGVDTEALVNSDGKIYYVAKET